MKKLIIVLILMMIGSAFAKCELKEYTNNTFTSSKKFAFFCEEITAVFIVESGNIERVYERFNNGDGTTFEHTISSFTICMSNVDEYGIKEETNCRTSKNNKQFMLEKWKSYKNML